MRTNMNKVAKSKFKEGDILVDGRGWKRKIVMRLLTENGLKYFYFPEKLNESFQPIGFREDYTGVCSEAHLIRKGFHIENG